MDRIVQGNLLEVIRLYHAQTAMESAHEVPSWVRRGHTRKPNGFVLRLYAIFDWFQDFGPMFSFIFRSVWKAAAGTWEFFVRTSLVLVNLALLVGIIYLSVGHSYSLLLYAGFSGHSAWVAVAVWEAVFIYCSIVIENAYRKGKKAGWAAWAGFGMGWIFVEISNFMGMANNWIGKAIGIATPILLLVMKKVLEHQFKKEEPAAKQKKASWFSWFASLFKRKASNNHQPEQPQSNHQMDDNQPDWTTKNQPPIWSNHQQKSTNHNHQPVNQPNHQPTTNQSNQPKNDPIDDQPTKSDDQPKPIKSKEANTDQPNQNVDNQPILESQINYQHEATTNQIGNQPPTNLDDDQPTDQSTTNQNEQPTTHQVDEPTTTDQPLKQPTTKSKKQPPTKKSGNKTTNQPTELMKKRARKWAMDYYREKGELPGRLKIQKGTGCSQHIARTTLDELKEELGIAS